LRAFRGPEGDQAITPSFLSSQDDKMPAVPQMEQPIHTFMREL
jgi:hypothetical protein